MLKKSLIITFILALAISPFLPQVQADSEAWHSAVSDKVWDYDSYRVQRLAFGSNVSGPYDYSDTVFFTKEANSCDSKDLCDQVDISIASSGKILNVPDVNDQITSRLWHLAQNDSFVYYTKATGKHNWFSAFRYAPDTKNIDKLTALTRKANELQFTTFATEGTRLFASLIQTDKKNGDVEPALSVTDFESGYERRDFTWLLTAPWQEIVDVHGDLALVKFQFEGGAKQLWLVDERKRTMSAIPNTWTQEPGDVLAAHFKSNGVVEYFRNYRFVTFDPNVQTEPVEHGGVYLNWFDTPENTIQVEGDRTAWIDSENYLYVSDLDGVSKFDQVTDNQFTLEKDAIYFASANNLYREYNFESKKWTNRDYHVTDSYQDILVGIDSNQDIWYENTTTNKLVNVGFGTDPVLSDRAHAYWKGVDGHVYEVSFSTLLDVADLEKPQAYKSYGNSTVYLLKENTFWKVRDKITYDSWFDSFDNVAEVTDAVMDLYLERYGLSGDAPFAPGTRVKSFGNPRVYVIGTDGKIHWLVSEAVADSIYGSFWNNNILELNPTYLWRYGMGANVNSNLDIKEI